MPACRTGRQELDNGEQMQRQQGHRSIHRQREYGRLRQKTREQQFVHELEHEFELSPRESRGILEVVQETFFDKQAESETVLARPSAGHRQRDQPQSMDRGLVLGTEDVQRHRADHGSHDRRMWSGGSISRREIATPTIVIVKHGISRRWCVC